MYEDITINQFIKARFNGDRTVMNDDKYRLCFDEFVDTAKLYEGKQFAREVNIKYLYDRVNYIACAVDLQKKFLKSFGIPFKEQLKDFEKYGHFPIWKNDQEDFEKKLDMIEAIEKPYISQLEDAIKLNNDAKEPDKPETSLKDQRGSFVKVLNSLGKEGYKIDRDKTTVEELAYMILQQFEENKRKA